MRYEQMKLTLWLVGGCRRGVERIEGGREGCKGVCSSTLQLRAINDASTDFPLVINRSAPLRSACLLLGSLLRAELPEFLRAGLTLFGEKVESTRHVGQNVQAALARGSRETKSTRLTRRVQTVTNISPAYQHQPRDRLKCRLYRFSWPLPRRGQLVEHRLL
jgi:hypothetical protein